MIAKFLDHNNRGSFRNDDGEGNENCKTKKLVCASHFFVHFLAMKLPNFTCPLYGVDTQNTKFSFSFSKL